LFEFVVVIMIGAMTAMVSMPLAAVAVIVVLFFVIRPAAVWLALRGSSLRPGQVMLASWFGIRGVGSLYYAAYAINKGVMGADADALLGITVAVLVASIVLHGISVTPLMAMYDRRKASRSARPRGVKS
ncbi:MAG: cation:proton antiporter, partial [Betaproteobacteria bacterium]